MSLNFAEQRQIRDAINKFVCAYYSPFTDYEIIAEERLGESQDMFFVHLAFAQGNIASHGFIIRDIFYPDSSSLYYLFIGKLFEEMKAHERRWPHNIGV